MGQLQASDLTVKNPFSLPWASIISDSLFTLQLFIFTKLRSTLWCLVRYRQFNFYIWYFIKMQKTLSWSELLLFWAVIFAIRTQLQKIQEKKYSPLCVKICWKNTLIRTEGSSQCCQIYIYIHILQKSKIFIAYFTNTSQLT